LPDGFRVIVVDLAEHGESRSSRGEWTIPEFARDVVAVLDAERVERCVVAGHSLGGACAVEVGRLRPGVVTHIVALDSLHYMFLYGPKSESQVRAVRNSLREDFGGTVRHMVEDGSLPGAARALIDAQFKKLVAVRQPAGTLAIEGLLAWDMKEALAALKQPITLFGVRQKVTQESIDHLGGRVNIVLVDLGFTHQFPTEAPEQTAKLIEDIVTAEAELT